MDRTAAETLALQALAHLAGDEHLLQGFMAASGMSAEELKRGAGEPAVLAGVLDYLLADETALLGFCESEGLRPELPARARCLLPGAAPPWP